MLMAEVKFGDGSIHLVTGRVVNREGVAWTSKEDAYDHIATVRRKSGVDVRLVRFVCE